MSEQRGAEGDEPEARAEPQTQPTDPSDQEVHRWTDEIRDAEAEQLSDLLAAWGGTPSRREPEPGPPVAPIAGDGDGDPGLPRPRPRVAPAQPLPSFFAYKNSRPDLDWNTCGQAAIASMVDFYGRDLGVPKTPTGHWDDGQAIDWIKEIGFGPDVPFGWGTTPTRIREALGHFGIAAEAKSSGLFFDGWPALWNRLLAYVYYSAIPVPVLIDLGLVGGPAWGAHWPILWKMERTSTDMFLFLGNWGRSWLSQPIPAGRFLEAWACRHLPLGFNHAAVYTGTPRIWF